MPVPGHCLHFSFNEWGSITTKQLLVSSFNMAGYMLQSFARTGGICLIIMKSLDPLRAKKIFIRKKLGHTAVSAIKASSVTL